MKKLKPLVDPKIIARSRRKITPRKSPFAKLSDADLAKKLRSTQARIMRMGQECTDRGLIVLVRINGTEGLVNWRAVVEFTRIMKEGKPL